MLNKLLKRCMPWMDKGRWYRVIVNKPVFGDAVFMLPPGWTGVKTSGSSHWRITTNIGPSFILDSKIRMYAAYEDDSYIPGTTDLLVGSALNGNGYLEFEIDYDIGVESEIKCVFDVFIEVI